MSNRDEFSKETLDVIAKSVGVRCSMRSCRRLTTGPRSDGAKIVCIGVAAHITAAAPGGPRYDASLATEERRAPKNGIWLCQNHAKLVDNDTQRYTVELLREWKHQAEAEALAEVEGGSADRAALEDTIELELLPDVEYLIQHPGKVKRSYDKSGTCDRHDYVLTVVVRNLGNKRLSNYHVDLEMPARVIEQPAKDPRYVINRSTKQRAFFRTLGQEIFPGDGPIAIAIPYFVDNELYWNHRNDPHVFKESVVVKLYRDGLPPITLERSFREMQNF